MPNRLLLVVAIAVLVSVAMSQDRYERVAVVAPAAYDGVSMVDEPLESQAKRAGAIVVARVTEIESYKTATSIRTLVTLEVEDYIKGSGPDFLVLDLAGGGVDRERVLVGGVPNFVETERALLLLDDASSPELLRLWQSKYSLAGSQAHQPEAHSQTAIGKIEERLEKSLSKNVTINYNSGESTSNFVVNPGCPEWQVSDLPVVFEVNPSSPGTAPPSGLTYSQLSYESWHAWQALSNSYAAFSYLGTTSRTGLIYNDQLNTVSWGATSSGVLGVNQCGYVVDGGGNPLYRIDSDTVISNNQGFGWDWDNSIQSGFYSLRAVMEHELGHGLGLGHSDQSCNGLASTPLMCPAVQSGQRKTILADDSAGAAAIYPLSGVAPGAPSGVTVTPGSGSNSVSWTASSGSKFAYDIERGNSACNGGWTPAGTVPSSSTSFVDDNFGAGLPAGTYCYRVKALGVGGDSGWALPAAQYGVSWGSHTTPDTMTASTVAQASVSFSNTGSLTWAAAGANPVRLSYHWRNGPCPSGSVVVWDGPRAVLPGDVASGGTVSNLNISVTPPSTAGSYCLVYDLVREGVTWFSTQGANTLAAPVTVNQPVYGVDWNSDTTPTTMAAGAKTAASVNITNIGSLTWPATGANPVRVSYHWRNGACPGSSQAVWDGVRSLLASNMTSGQSANVNVSITAPAAAGTYCLVYDLVREGITWFSTQGASTRLVQVNVQGSPYGVSWGSHNTPANMAGASTTQVSLTFTNTGSQTWNATGANPARLSYHWRNGACPNGSVAVWDGLRAVLPGNISQGQTVNGLNIGVLSPATPGAYCLVFDLVREGITWFSTQAAAVLAVNVAVGQPVYGVSFGPDTTPSTMDAGTATDVDVTFTNTGSLTWESSGANMVRLSYHWRNGACNGSSSAVWDGQRADLPGNVNQNEVVTDLTISVLAPATSGVYCLVFDLVREGVAWFSNQGAAVKRVTVTVQ